MGNKDKITHQVWEITLSNRHIIWKISLHGYYPTWRIIETNWTNTWVITKPFGMRSHEYYCSNTVRPSIFYHATESTPECSHRTIVPFLCPCNGTYHAPSAWTYYVFKGKGIQSELESSSMILKIRKGWYKPNSSIIKLYTQIFWRVTLQVSCWQALSHI